MHTARSAPRPPPLPLPYSYPRHSRCCCVATPPLQAWARVGLCERGLLSPPHLLSIALELIVLAADQQLQRLEVLEGAGLAGGGAGGGGAMPPISANRCGRAGGRAGRVLECPEPWQLQAAAPIDVAVPSVWTVAGRMVWAPLAARPAGLTCQEAGARAVGCVSKRPSICHVLCAAPALCAGARMAHGSSKGNAARWVAPLRQAGHASHVARATRNTTTL